MEQRWGQSNRISKRSKNTNRRGTEKKVQDATARVSIESAHKSAFQNGVAVLILRCVLKKHRKKNESMKLKRRRCPLLRGGPNSDTTGVCNSSRLVRANVSID